MIYTDWHIHSEASHDAALTLKEIAEGAKKRGYSKFGITDHDIAVEYLVAAGFKDGDIVGVKDEDLWWVESEPAVCWATINVCYINTLYNIKREDFLSFPAF